MPRSRVRIEQRNNSSYYCDNTDDYGCKNMTNIQEKGAGSKVKSLFPILTWLPNYNWKNIRFDLIAGIVIAGLIIPESMGIAGVAGVEPQHGLYAILIALFLTIFGSGRRSVVSLPERYGSFNRLGHRHPRPYSIRGCASWGCHHHFPHWPDSLNHGGFAPRIA